MINECVPSGECNCSCHTFPGTKHFVACCDRSYELKKTWIKDRRGRFVRGNIRKMTTVYLPEPEDDDDGS